MSKVEIALQRYTCWSFELTAEEKWNVIEPGSRVLYANPEECQKFLGSGEMTTSEFIRTHNTLTDNGFINWTDPAFHETLRGTVGQRFFHHMANLNMDHLDDLVAASLKQKVRYLDYGTECKLRRLLDNEKSDDANGVWAREHLRRHRDFYKKWETELFGDHVFQVPKPPPTIGHNAESQTANSAKSSGYSLRCNLYAILAGIIIIYIAIS